MTTSSFDNDKEAAKSAVERADDSLVHAPLEDLDTKELDVAGGWLAGIAARPDAAELLAPYTEAEEKKMLRWKIDVSCRLCLAVAPPLSALASPSRRVTLADTPTLRLAALYHDFVSVCYHDGSRRQGLHWHGYVFPVSAERPSQSSR